MFVSKTLSGDPRESHNKPFAIVNRKFLIAAIVVTELQFIQVPEQMKRFDRNIGPIDAAFEEAPEILKSIGMYLAANVFNRMVNNLMSVLGLKAIVRPQCIAVERRASFNIGLDFSMDGFLFAVCDYRSPHLAADSFFLVSALKDSHDCGFINRARTSDAPFLNVQVHVAGLAADESLIRFTLAGQKIESARLQGIAETVSHEPCRLLGYSEVAGQFTRTDAVLAVDHEPQSGKPLFQRYWRILKNGSSFQREFRLWMAAVAFPDAILGKVGHFLRAAVRAFNLAIGPAQKHHQGFAILEFA